MQEPCGTPTCTCLCGEVVLRCRQLVIRPRRYADSQRTVLCGSDVCVSEVMSLVWLTMSKALEKSIDMVSVRCGGLGSLKPEATVCVRGMSAVVVLCRVLKPCWVGDIGRVLSWGRSRRSRTLIAGDSREMGR